MITVAAPGVYTPPPSRSSDTVVASSTPPAVVADTTASQVLKHAVGDYCNRQTLADKLQALLKDLPRQILHDPALPMAKAKALMEAALASQLKNIMMYVCEDASYPPPLPVNRQVSVEAFLLSAGLELPTTLETLASLRDAVARQARAHPLGNLGGGLSWPVAMPPSDQRSLLAVLHSATSGLAGLPLAESGSGVLGYLLSGSSVSESDLNTPITAMEELLGSPKAIALGRALQSRLDGSPSGIGSLDYVLTAIHLALDPESQTTPRRTTVAGFDLAHSQHWGQPASVVRAGLARHLIEKGRATVQTAGLAAGLLLARSAPEYLVKDVPASVTCASVLWAQLKMAVGKLEAQAPGSTLSMGYAHILLAAEKLGADDVSQQIDHDALQDWGIANGFLSTGEEVPSADAMERVRAAYNRHLSSLKTGSGLLQTEIPSRKAMALALLKQTFAELDPRCFEVRNIQKAMLKEGRPGLYPGMRSMLDIVMEGDRLGPEDHWITADKRIPINRFCSLYQAGALKVATPFKTAYDAAISAHEEGQKTVVRHLISTLPLEDRKNLAEGNLEFFHTHQYKIAGDLFTPPALHTRGHTLEVKTTRNGQVNLYTIDTRRGVIEKENFLIRRRTEPYTANKMEVREANIVAKTKLFEPYADTRALQSREQPGTSSQPDSFNASRSHYIADVFVKSLDLNNDELLKQARDVTSYDQDVVRNEAILQFFLNLIPVRSAVVNFRNGNVGQGVFDLAMDVVGLVTLGAGKAAQAGKVLGKSLSSARQLAKAARFIGATAVEVFNPLSGLGDLAVGGGRLAVSGGRYAVEKVGRQLDHLRGATGQYGALKAASKQYGDAATGVFKVGGHRVEGGAVRQGGKWYALDAHTMRPYGRPLEDFAAGARAVDGKITHLPSAVDGELSNRLFRQFNVPESRMAGLSRNSQGVYVGAGSHLTYIRHTDGSGRAAVYDVRQLGRSSEGKVQARVYHNNRQTSLLVEHVQGDQWRRLGLPGGNPPSIKSDLGPIIGRGGEGVVYASLDGKRVYKDFGPTRFKATDHFELSEVEYLNKFYGDGFARTVLEDGRRYLVMGRIEGVDLTRVQKGSLPPDAGPLLADTFAQMEAKGIYHNDKQLANFMYSAKDNTIYPVDMDATSAEFMVPALMDTYQRRKSELLKQYAELIAKAP